MPGIHYDIAHLLGALVLLLSFALLYQRRLFALIQMFAIQSAALAAAAAWQGYIQDAPHLYITAALALIMKAIIILLVLPVTADVTALTREDLALALSVVLLGLLTMITRRNAIGQVVGFMSLENGLILAAVGVQGMPLIVEMLVAFAVMVAFIIFGIFFFHIRERFDTLDLHNLDTFRGEHR
jgi:hydrogenase-4 component E